MSEYQYLNDQDAFGEAHIRLRSPSGIETTEIWPTAKIQCIIIVQDKHGYPCKIIEINGQKPPIRIIDVYKHGRLVGCRISDRL